MLNVQRKLKKKKQKTKNSSLYECTKLVRVYHKGDLLSLKKETVTLV